MFKKSLVAALGLSALLSGYTQAENYFGGSVSFLDYSEEGISESASLTAIVGRLGTTFNENFSGEARLGLGLGDDTVSVFGYDADIELDNMFGAYVRGGLPVSESFYPYVILGYTRGEATISVGSYSESQSETDISFGLGADVNVGQSVTLNVEYMSYFDKDGAEINGFSFGVARKF